MEQYNFPKMDARILRGIKLEKYLVQCVLTEPVVLV